MPFIPPAGEHIMANCQERLHPASIIPRRSARLNKQVNPAIREHKSPKRKREVEPVSNIPPDSTHLSTHGKLVAYEPVPKEKSKKRKRENNLVSQEKRREDYRQKAFKSTEAITHWSTEGFWPKQDLAEITVSQSILARKRSTSSMRRKRSNTDLGPQSSSTSESRESKSAPYRDPKYETYLCKFNIFTEEGQHVCETSASLLNRINSNIQETPKESLFSDQSFLETCQMIHNQNEPRVIRDIGTLMVPSPGQLKALGAEELTCFAETVNEAWNNCIPVAKPRPQPDFSVGFKRSAFTKEQLEKLDIYIGETSLESCFMATFDLLFPFFTCEVKCGNAALDIADRQNLPSAFICGRGIFELFKLLGRQQELDQEYLSFSISHNDRYARIHAYLASVDGEDLTYYRKQVRDYSFTDVDGRDRWTSYKFTRNVYELYGLTLLKRLQSIIDQMPVRTGTSKPEPNFRPTGLSQELFNSSLKDESDVEEPLQPIPTPDPSNTQQGRKKRKGKPG